MHLFLIALLAACGGTQPAPVAPSTEPIARADVDRVLDAWHAAAAASDEDAYFALMADDSVFLGTDATERWDKPAFRAYAHPVFAAGRGWAFRSIRREVVVRGDVAWFDEDLDAPNLGASRGSGVLVRERGRLRIAQYNLALTIPNDRHREVKALLDSAPADAGVDAAP